ncbi:MAG: FAD-dependent oxidoreductase [Candidatus Competibacter denitrificans]
MPDDDLLIVGAGIAGLSMACYAAAAGVRVRVLEQEKQPGGCLHSHRFTGDLDGFWLELGAHSCFNSYSNLLALLEFGSVLKQLRRREKVGFRLFAAEAVHTIPAKLSIVELLGAPFRLLGTRKAGRTVGDYYGHIVGRRNYSAVFGPAFDAVICQPAADYPADHLFRPRPRRKEFPRGFTFSAGLQTIADVLAKQAGIEIEFGRTVQSIRRDGPDFIVQLEGVDYSAHRVCLATPVAIAADLLRSVLPALAERLAEIGVAVVESVGVGLPRERVSLPPLAGLIGCGETFYSAVSRDTLPDARFRGFTFHFRPGVLTEEGKLQRIAEVLGVARSELNLENVKAKRNQLPMLRAGHGQWTEAVNTLLSGSGLALTGNYFGGVAIEDCVARSKAEFERLQREGL